MKLAIMCLLAVFLATSEGFASQPVNARISVALHHQTTNAEVQASERRRFLLHTFSVGLATLSESAFAAEAGSKGLTTQAPRNRKISGLALKIRAVTHVMVRCTYRGTFFRRDVQLTMCLLRFRFFVGRTAA